MHLSNNYHYHLDLVKLLDEMELCIGHPEYQEKIHRDRDNWDVYRKIPKTLSGC
jgi:hypothetical protein